MFNRIVKLQDQLVGLSQHQVNIHAYLGIDGIRLYEVVDCFVLVIGKKITNPKLIIERCILRIVLMCKEIVIPGQVIGSLSLFEIPVPFFDAFPGLLKSGINSCSERISL